jgi:uncharacterized protein YutE (UPF0331/DUF86 family)
MVDPDVLRRKTEQVLHHVGRLRARGHVESEGLDRDEDLRNLLLMDLQQAIQGCIDLAVHACMDEALGAPSGPAAAFELLANAGRIPRELGVRLTGAAGLRNLIVHRYGDLDTAVVLRVIEHDLDDLERFVAALATVDAS